MTIYILLLLLSLILISVRHNAICLEFRPIIIFSFLALLFLLEIFRSINVGVDYGMYYGFFTSYDYDEMRTQFVEPAYAFLTNFSQYLQVFYIIPFFVLSIGLIGIFYLNHRFHLNKLSLLSFFVLTGFYVQSFDILRQYIAIGIICIGISLFLKLYKTKIHLLKYIVFILFVYLAFNFHKSAIIGLLLVILVKIRVKPITVILTGIISFILAMSSKVESLFPELMTLIPFYNTKYNAITPSTTQVTSSSSFIDVFIRLIPVILQFILLYFFVKRHYKFENYKLKFILSGYLIYLVLSTLISFWGPSLLRRFQMYFFIFPLFYSAIYIDEPYLSHFKNSVLLWSSKFKKESSFSSRIIFIILWIAVYIAKLLIDSEKIVPYEFI